MANEQRVPEDVLWRSDEAPRDGSPVSLLLSTGRQVEQAWWDDDDEGIKGWRTHQGWARGEDEDVVCWRPWRSPLSRAARATVPTEGEGVKVTPEALDALSHELHMRLGFIPVRSTIEAAAAAFVAVLPLPQETGERDGAWTPAKYAEQLAVSMRETHYPEVPQFEPMSGDLMGLLSQIDNMLTGLVRASPAAPSPASEPVGWRWRLPFSPKWHTEAADWEPPNGGAGRIIEPLPAPLSAPDTTGMVR